MHFPGGLGVRVNSALYAGYRIPPYYDSLIGKLIVFGKTRTECMMRLRRALAEFVIEGVETTIPLFQRLLAEPDIIDGHYDIHWLEHFLARHIMSATITPQILLKAYAAGIFPMAESAEDNALYWVEPEERGIIPLDGLVISRSLRKRVKRQEFHHSHRHGVPGGNRRVRGALSWTRVDLDQWPDQIALRTAFQDGLLPYRRILGRRWNLSAAFMAFGSELSSSAKACFHCGAMRAKWRSFISWRGLMPANFRLLDAQFMNPHLARLGALPLSRLEYHELLEPALAADADFFRFTQDGDPEVVLAESRRRQISRREDPLLPALRGRLRRRFDYWRRRAGSRQPVSHTS